MDTTRTRQLQEALVAQGYRLPRWGADGVAGEETMAAVAEWLEDHAGRLPAGAQLEEVAAAVVASAEAACRLTPGPLVLDARARHPGKARKGLNPWSRIDTVCLHQMACDDGSDAPGSWQRWRDLAIHFAVLRHGQAAWLYDANVLLWHGHGFNGRSVGLEIEGWYAGVEGRPGTLWAPPGAPASRKVSQALQPLQVEAACQAIRLAVQQVAAHGGRVKYIGAHRQAAGAERQADPGSAIWQAVALPMMAELGLSTAPTLKGGMPVPEAWDEAQAGVPY